MSNNSLFSNHWYAHPLYKSNIVLQRTPGVPFHCYIPRYPHAMFHTCHTMAKDDTHEICMTVIPKQ